MSGIGPRPDRRTRGLGALVVAFLATGVLPLLHLASHRDDHVHTPGGTIELRRAGAEGGEPTPPPERRAPHRHGADHGDGSLAHFAAYLDPVLPEIALTARPAPVETALRFLAVRLAAPAPLADTRSRAPPGA